MSHEYSIGSLLAPKNKPQVNNSAGAHMAYTVDDDKPKKDNPADPSSLAARLASGKVC